MWRFWLIMKMNKKAGIADFIGMVVSFVIILFILAVFVFTSGIFNKIVEEPAGVSSYNEAFSVDGKLFVEVDEKYISFLESRFEFRGEVESG